MSEDKEKFWDIIYNWYWDNIGWRIRYFKLSIKNIIRWFPIIWEDRDWDSDFIFIILKTKLKHQSDYIREHDRHTSAKIDSEKMNLCIRLIDKIRSSYYDFEYHDYQEIDYTFIDSDRPGFKEMIFTDISDNLDDYFKLYPLIYKKVLNGEGKLSIYEEDGSLNRKRVAMNMASINHNRAKRLLFKIMERDIEKWWD
jgi:hypothetical protein